MINSVYTINNANIINIVNKTKLKLLSENETTTLIFMSYKDPMNSKIFPEEERLSNP